ncbi:hypothetical protein [Tannerella forsythia]|uniref:HlyD family secretion protein n=1 Tax=Tannerella forsythia TaxID=28112 RepID=A0A3P1XV45_TANFO|nr:hypothetical protein [Tannerella forsythia]RRD62649.1 hypothetical protein EII40_02255 [Tannerella forsythia]
MEERQKQERSFELRSEKVRSIVGQIPSSLVRYGITIIGVVLVILTLIAYYLPYKSVYSGSASIYTVPQSETDSLEVSVKLRFDGKRIETTNYTHLNIELYGYQESIWGTLLEVSSQRDTLDRQQAIVRFAPSDISTFGGQTVDFRIVESSESILQKVFGRNQASLFR